MVQVARKKTIFLFSNANEFSCLHNGNDVHYKLLCYEFGKELILKIQFLLKLTCLL